MTIAHRYFSLVLATAVVGLVLSVQPVHADQVRFVPDV